jgi:transcriptional activator SPT7
VNLETVIHRTVDELHTSRSIINSIYDWQRLEAEGGAIPPIKRFDREKEIRREEEAERKRVNREEGAEASKRRKLGGEVGERQAALGAKRATAGMLAHAGFDGEFMHQSQGNRADAAPRCERGGTGSIH